VFGLKRIVLLTGPSGVGKTSVLRRTVKELKNRGYEVGGMICRDVREGGLRVGFEVMDLSTGTRGWLAHTSQPVGPKVGKYRVNLIDLDVIGVGAILYAIKNADVLAVDEIGPMEFSLDSFNDALLKVVESYKPMLGTIHYRLTNSTVEAIKKRDDTEIIAVTYENRENLHNLVADKLSEQITKKQAY
jgi:nucleoside-triphosphatase